MNTLPAELQGIKTWVFDLDNTLYHASINLFDQIDKRMCSYVAKFLNIPVSDAYKVQKQFFRQYGTTLRGMMDSHEMDPNPYLDYVHAIDFSVIKSDKRLEKAIGSLPGEKFIFTNATATYAKHVISRLGIKEHFRDIFDIIDANYVPKPAPLVYAEFVKKFNVNPRNSIMFEDIARNLEPAAKLGMKTVWIQTDAPWSKAGINSIRPDYTTTCLSEWLGKIAGLENAPQ